MNYYHRSNSSVPSAKRAHEGPLTVDERVEIIDRLSCGSMPRACLVRKLLRLHDEQRAELSRLNEMVMDKIGQRDEVIEKLASKVLELNALKADNNKPVSGV